MRTSVHERLFVRLRGRPSLSVCWIVSLTRLRAGIAQGRLAAILQNTHTSMGFCLNPVRTSLTLRLSSRSYGGKKEERYVLLSFRLFHSHRAQTLRSLLHHAALYRPTPFPIHVVQPTSTTFLCRPERQKTHKRRACAGWQP